MFCQWNMPPFSFPSELYGRVEKVLWIFNDSKDCWMNSIDHYLGVQGGPVFTVGYRSSLVHVLLVAEQELALNRLLSFHKGRGLIWAVFSRGFIYFRKYCCRWWATRPIISGGKLRGWPHFQNHELLNSLSLVISSKTRRLHCRTDFSVKLSRC